MSDLAAAALQVLESNWLGSATKPAPHLYPHQWSWDSAFIAIGNRHHRWERAALELETLFGAQWSNGLVPHIVFSETDAAYFPNAAFWSSATAVSSPRDVSTSGIIQPPVHATAVRMVFEAGEPAAAQQFLERIYPRLVAWHDYLTRDRIVDHGLIEIWHPWESGMDNSPLWDEPLARMEFGPEEVPEYRRVDNAIAAAEDRPTDRQYDEYAYLVGALRDQDYVPANPAALPFRVEDVLFNSAFVMASRDLAWLGSRLGEATESIEEAAGRVEGAIDAHLWSDEHGLYLNRDARSDKAIPARSCSGVMPLLYGPADPSRRAALLATVENAFLEPMADGSLVPSVPVGDPGFSSKRYWRGPAWIQINWLIQRALARAGDAGLADELKRGMLSAVAAAGMWEYFDVTDASGHGSDNFSWTAALVLDLLAG